MSLVQPLPSGPLDIVGDVHGEYDALRALLGHLHYDAHGVHPDGRTLVFIGDLCDRGPDSPAVLAWVQRLVESGRACALAGNHEINLLRDDAKDGAGWFFDGRSERDAPKYAPFARAAPADRPRFQDFVAHLPVALERADLRLVHAAWLNESIAAARPLPLGALRAAVDQWEQRADALARETGLGERMRAEMAAWGGDLEQPHLPPPFLHAHAEHEANKQRLNPVKVLTSGVERPGGPPFFAGGKWRFSQRVAWWDAYGDATPVVMGHYWRRRHPIDRSAVGKEDADLFESIAPLAWHGLRRNVFCVDFSVGGSWRARKDGLAPQPHYKLAALRWPERVLQFDDGSREATQGFGEHAR